MSFSPPSIFRRPSFFPAPVVHEGLSIRQMNLTAQNETLRTTLSYVLDAIASKNTYDNELEWDLALTLAACKARKVLK